ncbi:hypothetical protein [Nonomuraea sp. NPDC052265]|uniref:hypothetical protein n=1 Tax=Nonomuraea sp. NPDC052265 TaxID=3364374 RepID=UPI0037C56977
MEATWDRLPDAPHVNEVIEEDGTLRQPIWLTHLGLEVAATEPDVRMVLPVTPEKLATQAACLLDDHLTPDPAHTTFLTTKA